MRLLLLLAVVMLPLEAAADPASAKAWLCQRSPGLAMCRTVEPRASVPPAAMPEEEPIEYLPPPLVSVPNHPMPPVTDAPVPPVASPPATVADKPVPEAVPVVKHAPAPTPAKAKPKPHAVEHPVRKAQQPVARPSSGMCAQIAMGIAAIGKAGVIAEARKRGYSAGQINSAARACGY